MKYEHDRNNNNEEEELTADEIREKIQYYSSFVDKVLQPQLKSAVKLRENVESEIDEYQELSDHLTTILKRYSKDIDEGDAAKKNDDEAPPPLEAKVDLGHQVAYCKAVVHDPQTVYVHVGMEFHIEFALEEAIKFIARRMKFLRYHVLPKRAEKAKDVATDLEHALFSLEALCQELRQNESNNMAKKTMRDR